MFNTIRAKLFLFSAIIVALVCISIAFSYAISIRSIKSIMKTDANAVADALEKNINNIARYKPDAYQDPDFKKMIYSMKIGKTGNVTLMDSSGTLRVHATEEGINKAGEAFIDHVRTHKEPGTYEFTNLRTKQEKIAAYRYIKAWDMWIWPTINKADYFDLLKKNFLKWNAIFGVIIILVLVVTSLWITRTLTSPLKGLLRILKGTNETAGSDTADSRETRTLLCRLLENLL